MDDMADPDLLSYRELQQLAKRLSLGAGGKKASVLGPHNRTRLPDTSAPLHTATRATERMTTDALTRPPSLRRSTS